MTTFANPTNLATILDSKRFKFYVADVNETHIMERIFRIEKPNYVIHLAGGFIHSVAQASKEHGAERIVAVGERGQTFVENDAQAWFNLQGLDILTANFYDLYGPREAHTGLIPSIIKKVLNGEDIDPEDYDTESRERMYLKDAFLAIAALLQYGEAGKIYDVMTGYRASDREMLYKLSKIMGFELPENTKESAAFQPLNHAGYTDQVVDIESIGWKPTFEFDQSLEHTACWYYANRWALEQELS